MSDELYHLNYKNIMTLKCISMLHNVKIIVFVCFTVDLKVNHVKMMNTYLN